MELFDLTMPLWPGMPVPPGDPPVELAVVRSHAIDGYQVTHFSFGSHTGTHLDAPRHFFPEGATIDRYPLDRLVGPGIIVDCRPPPGTTEIDEALLAERLRAFAIPPLGIVLLWTDGACLSLRAGQLLLEAGVGLVGTDGPSLDTEPHPVHHLLLSHGVLLAENLSRLDRVGTGPVNCAILPLRVVDADGAPVRAIAWR